jgi:hypothetical protein
LSWELKDDMTRDYFRADNTEGYTVDDLACLNDLFRAMCATEGVDPVEGEKSHLDHLGARVLAAYDKVKASGIVQIGRSE